MSDGARTQKRRLDWAPRGVARYGDAVGRSRGGAKSGPRPNVDFAFNFSSPGLALLGLRRTDRRAGGAK